MDDGVLLSIECSKNISEKSQFMDEFLPSFKYIY